MPPLSDKLIKKLEAAANQVLNQMGRDGVKYIKWLASVPVGRGKGGPFRSEPGEPPRKDTGTLYRSIKYRIERRGKGADLVFYSDDNPAKVHSLEDGTDNMEPRPLWKTAKKDFGDLRRVFEQRLREKLRSMKGDPFGLLPTESED